MFDSNFLNALAPSIKKKKGFQPRKRLLVLRRSLYYNLGSRATAIWLSLFDKKILYLLN